MQKANKQRGDRSRVQTRSSKIASIESRLFFMPYTRRVGSAGDVSSAAAAEASEAKGDAEDEDDEDEDEDASAASGVDFAADLRADLAAEIATGFAADFTADLAADFVPMKPPVAGVFAFGVLAAAAAGV